MHRIDLKEYKNKLRTETKEWRRNLPKEEKAYLDSGVLRNVLKMREYKSAEKIFIYVSTAIEVDTLAIIDAALKDGKKVAVPRCIPETRGMTFHYIDSIESLRPGTFSVLEPSVDMPLAEDFSKSLMLVPAMIIDKYGYRLGYGKGYYDRYISNYTGVTAGLCYIANLRNKIFHGRFDRKLDYIITEKYIKKSLV